MAIKTFTSASANKFIRAKQDEKDHLLSAESDTCTYVQAQDEEPDPPAYDYGETRRSIDEIDRQVRLVRHALHRFNMETRLEGSDMTIDEALIAMAQLSAKRRRLDTLRSTLPKRRESYRYGSLLAEYRYANYDVERAQEDYLQVLEAIDDLQLKIDLCNQTLTFDVDL